MPRYIDADLIPYTDDDDYLSQYAYRYDINEVPTADVVPKSEVEILEREVKLLTENTITAKYPHCVLGSYYAVLTKSLEDYEKVISDISSATKADVAREIFEEIGQYAELQIESLNIAEKVHPRAKEFFGGGKQAFDLLLDKLAELKKKYTEGGKSK